MGDAYAVVATQDSTQLSCGGFDIGTLNAGQVYYKSSNSFEDMTGTHIVANKPVAFFAVSRAAAIPVSVTCGSSLFQQLAPVKTWSKRFFVPSSSLSTRDRIRIMVSQNNTDITTIIGGTIQTDAPGAQLDSTNLQAGQFVELEVDENGCYIEANKPIGICSYFTQLLCVDSRHTPAQCWIPAIGQTVSSITVAPFISNFYSQVKVHYALICVPFGTEVNTIVSIGGAPFTNLIGGSWINNLDAGMSFYQMPLTNDTASYFFANQAGLFVLCYGIADNIGQASYYYLAGSAMRELDAAFYANDVHFQDLKDTAFCAGNVNFRAEIENMGVDMDSIKWFINGEENLPYNQLEWSKAFLSPGNYEIRMCVRFENNDTISKADTLKIKNCEVNVAFYANNVLYSSLRDTTFCAKEVDFHTDIEGLNTEQDSIKWYIDIGDDSGFIEYVPVRNLKQWSKAFPTGVYLIKMLIRLENDDEIEITGTLRMEVFWIKMRNVRY